MAWSPELQQLLAAYDAACATQQSGCAAQVNGSLWTATIDATRDAAAISINGALDMGVPDRDRKSLSMLCMSQQAATALESHEITGTTAGGAAAKQKQRQCIVKALRLAPLQRQTLAWIGERELDKLVALMDEQQQLNMQVRLVEASFPLRGDRRRLHPACERMWREMFACLHGHLQHNGPMRCVRLWQGGPVLQPRRES